MKYLILFFLSFPVIASDKLTVESWPKKQLCNRCVTIQTQGYVVSLKSTTEDPIQTIYSSQGLGLYIKFNNKTFSFGKHAESTLPYIKESLKVDNWVKYYELIAVKSSDKKIEGLRKALEITAAKGLYKYSNKQYTVFFIDLPNAPLGTPSEIMIIPNNKSEI